MRARMRKIPVAIVVVAALSAGGAAWATSGRVTAGDDRDESVSGPGAERAGAAAVAHLGGGRVTGVERESEGREAWEVEVTRADGSTVDVSLDESYGVIASAPDFEGADDSDAEISDGRE